MSLVEFTGKRVLVTGGGKGIGKAIALKFLELKATVFVLDNDELLLSELSNEYPSITTVAADLRDWEATRKAVEAILPIYHLANNAGIAPTSSFLDVDLNHINAICDVNFKAALNVAQVVAKGMIEHGIKDGTIVSTSSMADSVAVPTTSVYGAFKAALTMLTKTMAVELAPHGIRVNCVCPGLVRTELVTDMPKEFQDAVYGPTLERMLFHKMIEPLEVANAFVYLSSSMSTAVTGTALAIDQGYTIQ